MRAGGSAYSVCRQDVIYGDVRPAHPTTPQVSRPRDRPLKLRWLPQYTPAHSLKLLGGALQCNLHQALCLRDHPRQMKADNSTHGLIHLTRHHCNSKFTITTTAIPGCSHLCICCFAHKCQIRSWCPVDDRLELL